MRGFVWTCALVATMGFAVPAQAGEALVRVVCRSNGEDMAAGQIVVDGMVRGECPRADLFLPEGPHELVVRHDLGRDRVLHGFAQVKLYDAQVMRREIAARATCTEEACARDQDWGILLEHYPNGKYAAIAREKMATLGQNPGTVFRDCSDCPPMVSVPAGAFLMSSPADETDRYDDEDPQHWVTIAQPFAVGRFEVTFDDWDACAAAGGCPPVAKADWGRGNQPVIHVSWQDAQHYIKWLSRRTGKTYRLLSEAEWEYAARAGTTTPFHTGPQIQPSQANFDAQRSYNGSATGQYREQTVAVGSFLPNAFGLYDMHGNVGEWVQDCFHPNYNGAPVDGSAWMSGTCDQRVARGGSWYSPPWKVRSAMRKVYGPAISNNEVGFRVARSLP